MRVLGVDACRSGWVAVELLNGTFARAYLVPHLRELPLADTVGVDIPLGLHEDRFRVADRAAAKLVGPRRGSVFLVPPRPVWQVPDYAEANALCRQLTQAGLSRQSHGLRTKVLEADGLRDQGHPLYEVHPEVSFWSMAGAPLAFAKTTWSGLNLRRGLLEAMGIDLPGNPGPAGLAGPDDVLDAAAVAWSAHRIATGQAASVPDPPERDQHGPIAIWY